MRAAVSALCAALVLLAGAAAAADVVLDPPDWNFGRVAMDRPITRTLAVTNGEGRAVAVTLVSTCGCLEAAPSQVELAPGATAEIELSYRPEEPGRVSLYFVVRAAPLGETGGSTRLYEVRGMVDAPRWQQAPAGAPGGAAAAPAGAPGGAADIARRLAAPALFAAGLVDGINPCAFTTIVFLLTSLVLAARRRAQVLLVGCGFTASVFVTYLLVGLGFFHSLRAASAFPLVSSALRWTLVAVLLCLAGLSLYDYALARRGRAAEMVLRLPDPIKRRGQRAILSGARSTALVGGSLVLGALVSLFEPACTGQVYLPAAAWLVRTQGGPKARLLLAVYNLGFILPLAAVFVAAWTGVSSRTLAAFAGKRIGAVKLALAVVFVGLAGLTLAT